jgi:hypothetical protein
MWEDPIVEEVHRAREKPAADCNYDIDAFFADIGKRQALQSSRLIAQKKRAPTDLADREASHDEAPEASGQALAHP